MAVSLAICAMQLKWSEIYGIDRDDFWTERQLCPRRTVDTPDTYNYPAEIERDEDGRFVVAFPDFGWGATDGASRDEALAEAKDLLREIIATMIREGGDLPEPSRAGKGRPLVVPPVQIVLKAALYDAWRETGLSQHPGNRAPSARWRGAGTTCLSMRCISLLVTVGPLQPLGFPRDYAFADARTRSDFCKTNLPRPLEVEPELGRRVEVASEA